MAKQTINIGTTANDGTGDPLRTAFDKVNSNFTELYNDDTGDVNSIIAGDGISVDTATGNVTITNTITNNNQLTNGAGYVDGTGTANYIAKWTDGDTIGNSVIYDNGTNVGIGTGVPTEKIQVVGNGLFTGNVGLGVAPLTAIGNKRLTIYETNSTSLVLSNSNNFVNIFNGSTVGDPTSIFSNAGFKFATASDASATGFSEKMRITSSGNVGIGTSSPSAKLDVVGAIKSSSSITGTNQLLINKGDATTLGGSLSYDSNANQLYLYNHISTGFFSIYTNASERMRITSTGNVGIGTSSPRTKFEVNQGSDNNGITLSNSARGASRIEIQLAGTVNEAVQFLHNNGTDRLTMLSLERSSLRFYTNGTEGMRLETNRDLHVDGDVIAYSTTISDQRLKDDVQTINNALDKVSNLRGVSYTWNNGNRKGQKDLGLIAQEVEQVLPELVREKEMPMIDGGTYKTVDYEKIVGVLIEAVKELKAEIEILKSK